MSGQSAAPAGEDPNHQLERPRVTPASPLVSTAGSTARSAAAASPKDNRVAVLVRSPCHGLGLMPDAGHGGHARMNRMPTDHNPPEGISCRLTSPSAVSADPPRVNDYDGIAEAYSAENEANLVNAYYERPAMLTLAGDVVGRRILDAGCGSGPLAAALRDRGAIVTGFDKSAGMIELGPAAARRRRGPARCRPGLSASLPRQRLRRRHRVPGTALPAGLGPGASRAAARAQVRRPADRVRRPSFCR